MPKAPCRLSVRRPDLSGPARVAIAAALSLLCPLSGSARRQTVDLPTTPLPAAVTRTLDPVIDALWARFSLSEASAHVGEIGPHWRLVGNAAYDAAIDRVRGRLLASGFADARDASPRRGPSTWIETYPKADTGWSQSIGTLAIMRDGRPDEVILSRDRERLALCINSLSTPPGGLVAPLVDVGRGAAGTDYAGRDLRGAVVLGDADATTLWRLAVVRHGAAGVVSTQLDEYISPDRPGVRATPRDLWDILQWDQIPYDDAHPAFGFKATPRASAALRQALRADQGRTRVHVTTATTFSANPARTLVAEIPGRSAPGERIVIAAHVQEPGASDNASGVATLVELARALQLSVAAGRIPAPERTITFLWLDETAGSRKWLKDHADQLAGVKYMFSLDMTGEDVRQTGGTFLIERWPDPGAVWDRPWDPHSEWGRGNVRAGQLKGDLINDLHLAVSRRVARKTGWIVKTNPYEGGSDHTEFGAAGVPSVLDWHFTDRYYHTNFDTPDKTSAAEMRNVAVAVGASAWLLASAREPSALDVADLVARAGRVRIALEQREGAKLVAPAEARGAGQRQVEIVSAWRKWYVEAVRSASRLVVGPVSPAFATWLDELVRTLE